MKIGILTLHFGANYGGTLQSIALFKTLILMGHNVEVIDFRPTQTASILKRVFYNLSCIRSWNDLFHTLSHVKKHTNVNPVSAQLINIFDNVRKEYLIFSPPVNEDTIANLNSSYDAIVVGSDQVWGSLVRNRLTYMGDWLPRYEGKLISYAACAISEKYPLVRRHKIQQLLDNFCAISVRDKTSQNFVKKMIRRNVDIVADPTLLYDFNEFIEPVNIDGPYILTYILGNEIQGGNSSALKLLKEQISPTCKIVAVSIYGEDCEYADTTIKNATPQLWISLIVQALCVFTDSFHGSLFSLKNNVPLVAYYRERNRASRLLDLSSRIDFILANSVSSLKDILSQTGIKQSSNPLIELQKASIKFLKESLE